MSLSLGAFACRDDRSPQPGTILVVSGWQDVNIGDIAHTPGLLHVLQSFVPDANIILWKRSEGKEVQDLLLRNFPTVKIIYGKVDDGYEVDNPEVTQAFERADLMIHGSGPSIVGRSNLEAWVKHSDKPFGVFGTTIQQIDEGLKRLLKKASFIYTRETKSLEVLKANGISGDHTGFAPDATFYFNLKDVEKAEAFLKARELEDKKFICAIPRLRYTPYHKIRPTNWTEEKIRHVEEVNDRCKEWDHAKLREAMIAWVRETGGKVLICPEMTYEVEIMDELLVDPLPEDVKPFVLKHDYWMPDEAASIYAKAHTVLSFECHSPILAATVGTPIFYLRQPEDTIKGQMYYDLGLDDWVFEIEETEGHMIADALRTVWQDYDKAKEKLETVMKKVDKIYAERTIKIRRLLA